jgi:F420-non-reducing hydrogenase iron-sulfur subunit
MSIESNAGFQPELVVLYCQSALAQRAEFEAAARRAPDCRIRPVALPCTCKVEIGHLFKILEQGTDGIEIVACAGDGCQFLTGNLRIQRQLERARRLLGHTKIGGGRLWLDLGRNLTAEQMLGFASERAREIQALGRNPLRRESEA